MVKAEVSTERTGHEAIVVRAKEGSDQRDAFPENDYFVRWPGKPVWDGRWYFENELVVQDA